MNTTEIKQKGSTNISTLISRSFRKISINKFTLTILLTGITAITNAQVNNSMLIKSDTNSVIEERLVALALQGPEAKNLEHQNKINEYTLKNAQNQWMNLLAVSLNYNDQSFSKTPTTSYVYPKYYFGLTIPLGTILSRTQVKSAKESIEMGKNNQEILRRNIREEVLTKYREYRAYSQLISIQSELVNDVQAELAQTEEKFRKGTVTIDTYNAAQKGNSSEMATLINLKLQQEIKKLEIERMIGVKLETVTNR
jgi:outer membrane protein TolC